MNGEYAMSSHAIQHEMIADLVSTAESQTRNAKSKVLTSEP